MKRKITNFTENSEVTECEIPDEIPYGMTEKEYGEFLSDFFTRFEKNLEYYFNINKKTK